MFNTALDKYFIRALNILHFTELFKVAHCAKDPKFSELHSCGPQTQPTQTLGMEGMGNSGYVVVLKPKCLKPHYQDLFSFLLFERRAAESFLQDSCVTNPSNAFLLTFLAVMFIFVQHKPVPALADVASYGVDALMLAATIVL